MATEFRRIGRRLGPTLRSSTEEHRVASTLELLFDLCFVVAVSQVSSALHHDVADGHVGHAIGSYLLVFPAIWWGWMNFTWFATAHDSDDVVYRLLVVVQMLGVLIIASGVGQAFEGSWPTLTIGYVVMRVGLVASWLLTARNAPAVRATALTYGIGILIAQIYWIAIINWTGTARTWAMLMGFAIELFVIPPLAEKKNDVIHWHSEHISERYGLFTIIVLGETILSAVLALEAAEGTPSFKTMLLVAGGGLLCAFAFWWLYFGRPNLRAPEATRRVFLWGYTHLVVWASIAAFGAGLAVIAEAIEGHGEASVAIASTVLPGALVLAGLGLVNLFGDGSERTGFARAMLSGAIFMALLGAVVPMEWTAVAVAVVLAFEVAWLVIRFGPPGLERYSTSAAR